MQNAEQRRLRGLIAINTKFGRTENVTQTRRLLKESKAVDYIKELVDGFPPLTQEQRDRLATLLRGQAEDAA